MIGWVAISLALLTLVAMHPPWLEGLKSVDVTEVEVRAFLGNIGPNPNPIINHTRRSYPGDPDGALFSCLVLPSTNLFSVEGLRGMRDAVAENGGFAALKTNTWRAQAVYNFPLLRRAVVGGWISWNDLAIQPADSAVAIRADRSRMYSPDKWDHFLSRGYSWSWVKKEKFNVMRIKDYGLAELRFLRDVNCLDLVDREKLIQQIASVQTLSGTPLGQPPIHDWRDVRGLFFTPCWPALQDAYFSLAALEILGGLDRIDREACIAGILKQHRGKGFFTSPDSSSYNEYHIRGDARDTFCAFESLRILSALDRVKDLERWQFRPDHGWSPWGNNPKGMSWNDIEAWVCRQRFERFLRERKVNPHAPPRSLLEP